MIEMLIAYQLLISSYNVFAQNDSPESKRIVLTLEVNPQRDKYEDLDIVQLRLRLINNSSSSITLTEIPVVGHGIKVQMAAPESEFQEIYSFIDGNCRPAGLFPNIVIEPQQAFQSTIYVSPALHSKDGFAPASIGTWRIRAIFTDKQSERVVESKQVTIQLTKSEPVSDGGLFRSKEWHRLVLAGGVLLIRRSSNSVISC